MDALIDQMMLRVVAGMPDAVAVVRSAAHRGRPRHRVEWANPAFLRLAGTPVAHVEISVLAAGDAGEVIGNLLDTGAPGVAETFWARQDGASVAVRVTTSPLGGPVGERVTAVIIRERSEELRAEEHLRASEAQFRVLAENAPIGIFRSEVGLRLGYANARCNEILGIGDGNVHGTRWLDTLAPADRSRVVAALERVLDGEEVEVDQVKVERPDGTARWVSFRVAPVHSARRAGGFVGSVEDVTERRLLEQALSHDATHDRLTGLPNRVLLWQRLQEELCRPRPEVAVLFLDLDDFKFVNDSLGHDAGDELLLAVADRLAQAVRPQDLVTRFGGDEFVIVCTQVDQSDQAERIADRLVEALREPFTVAGREIGVTASMGLVLGTELGPDPEVVLRDADVALYQAKAAGKARWALFDERVRDGVTSRLAMAGALRRAVESDGLSVQYQPIVDLATGRTVGVEALARWDDAEFGRVPPAKFIALAEDMGLIDRLGEQILRTSCRQLARWQDELGGDAPEYVSVNLSARQLSSSALVDVVRGLIGAAGLLPGQVCLELTESVFMEEIDGAVAQLAALRAIGVRLAMDDFGTGYSSLSSLRRFPGEFLKIDRSFVAGLRSDPAAPAIIAAVLDLARAMGLVAVAEGVETADDADLVESLGCRFAQGYLFAPPMTDVAVTAWLRATALGVAR